MDDDKSNCPIRYETASCPSRPMQALKGNWIDFEDRWWCAHNGLWYGAGYDYLCDIMNVIQLLRTLSFCKPPLSPPPSHYWRLLASLSSGVAAAERGSWFFPAPPKTSTASGWLLAPQGDRWWDVLEPRILFCSSTATSLSFPLYNIQPQTLRSCCQWQSWTQPDEAVATPKSKGCYNSNSNAWMAACNFSLCIHELMLAKALLFFFTNKNQFFLKPCKSFSTY